MEITDPPVEQKPGNAGAAIFDNAGLDGNVSGSGQLTLARPTDTLWLDRASTSTGKVANFGAQKSMDFPSTFGAQTMLGYSEDSSNPGGNVAAAADGDYAATIALLGNYMAGSFATTVGDHRGTLILGTPQAEQQPLLTHPPHG